MLDVMTLRFLSPMDSGGFQHSFVSAMQETDITGMVVATVSSFIMMSWSLVVSSAISATSTSSTAASLTATSPANLSDAQKEAAAKTTRTSSHPTAIGAGVGVPLEFLLLASLVDLSWREHRRRVHAEQRMNKDISALLVKSRWKGGYTSGLQELSEHYVRQELEHAAHNSPEEMHSREEHEAAEPF